MRHVGPGLAWRERQPFQAKLPVEPMPAADRTGLKTRPRQEEIVSSKSFACGYRLGAISRKVGLS
jgi:hypothetical protein